MKIKTRLALYSAILGILSSFVPAIAFAQTANDTINSGGFQSNERSSMGGGLGDGSFNPFNLIHNANLLNGRSVNEYVNEQQENLDTAREDFLRQRQNLLRNYKPNSATPTQTESSPEQ